MSIPDEDSEIEASRAPLLDHLVELRKRLIVCVAALAIGFVVCFIYAKPIYILLLRPFEVAVQMQAVQQAGGVGFGQLNMDVMLALLGLKQVPTEGGEQLRLVFTAPLEFFFTQMKLAGFGAVVLTFPILAWQVYRFVAPGLYRRERKAFLPFLLAAPVLFAAGAAMVYFIVLPFVLAFSLSQEVTAATVAVDLLPKVSDYLNLVTTLLLAFGLCFQLPIVLTLCGLAGLVSAKTLASGRRYAVVGIFVVAAFVTPPDVISQTLLSIPILVLYEVSIWCVRLIELRRKREEAREATAV